MFKARQDVNATDGDGVRNDRDNEFCSITFYVTGEVFKMNNFVSKRKLETILDSKGGIIK